MSTKYIPTDYSSYVSLNRPLPFAYSDKFTAIDLIKRTKFLTANEKYYNTYFKKYYDINESETKKSEVSKKIVEESLKNKTKNTNFSSLFDLEDNNTFMEVMFNKNFQSRKNKEDFHYNKITKNKNHEFSLPSITITSSALAPVIHKMENSSLTNYNTVFTDESLKMKKYSPMKINKGEKLITETKEKISKDDNKNIILEYLYDKNTPYIEYEKKEEYSGMRLQTETPRSLNTADFDFKYMETERKQNTKNYSKEFIDLIESKDIGRISNILSKTNNDLDVREYYFRYFKSKKFSLELKPIKIEIANFSNDDFFKKDFYLPYYLSYFFQLSNDCLRLAILSLIICFDSKNKNFNINTNLTINSLINLYRNLEENNCFGFKQINSCIESKSYLYVTKHDTYDIKIYFPQINLKIKKLSTKLIKILDFDSFAELYQNEFKNWDSRLIDILVKDKKFNQSFLKLVSITSKDIIVDEEYYFNQLRIVEDIDVFFNSSIFPYIQSTVENNESKNELVLLKGFSINYGFSSKKSEFLFTMLQSKKINVIRKKIPILNFLERGLTNKEEKIIKIKNSFINNNNDNNNIKNIKIEESGLEHNDSKFLQPKKSMLNNSLSNKKSINLGNKLTFNSINENFNETKNSNFNQTKIRFDSHFLDKLSLDSLTFFNKLNLDTGKAKKENEDFNDSDKFDIKLNNMTIEKYNIKLNELKDDFSISLGKNLINNKFIDELLSNSINLWKELLKLPLNDNNKSLYFDEFKIDDSITDFNTNLNLSLNTKKSKMSIRYANHM